MPGGWQPLRQNDLRDIALVEIGPGRGTLMFDMLRTLGKLDPELKNALPVHMVEISPRLSELQRGETCKFRFSDCMAPVAENSAPDTHGHRCQRAVRCHSQQGFCQTWRQMARTSHRNQ